MRGDRFNAEGDSISIEDNPPAVAAVQGRMAARKGEPSSANPYKDKLDDRTIMWHAGWKSGQIKTMAVEDWNFTRGPRGGSVWSNVRTGEVRHQKENPGGNGSIKSADDPEEPKRPPVKDKPRSTKRRAVRGELFDATVQGKGKTKKIFLANGEPAPSHIQEVAAAIQPGWTNIKITVDPESDLVATGVDSKGRTVPVYTTKFKARNAESKRSRVSELMQKKSAILEQIDKATQNSNPAIKTSADILSLIASTGLRTGSTRDTKADKQAYGATTLLGRHVFSTPRGVRLKFTGKKGVPRSVLVKDEKLANMLLKRKRAAGKKGRLFSVSAGTVQKYARSLDGGKFMPKDFRTMLGTESAVNLLSSARPARDEQDYRKKVNAIGDKVAKILGNTRKVALQSYIDPTVFGKLMPT